MITKIFKHTFLFSLIIGIFSIIFASNAKLNYNIPKRNPILIDNFDDDTIKGAKLNYPIPEEDINPANNKDKSPLYGSDPSNIETEVVYDAESNQYIFQKKIGGENFGTPYSMSFDEYLDYDFEKAMKSYWRQRSKDDISETRDVLIPKLQVDGEIFDRIFGGSNIDIRPQGSAELIFGLKVDKIENPAMPLHAQSPVTFDFQEKFKWTLLDKLEKNES